MKNSSTRIETFYIFTYNRMSFIFLQLTQDNFVIKYSLFFLQKKKSFVSHGETALMKVYLFIKMIQASPCHNFATHNHEYMKLSNAGFVYFNK